jgi:uncharacterized Fe-S center protein
VLEGVNPYMFNGQRPSREEVETFRRRALESHLAVRTAMEGRVFYVNFIWDVTPQPVYYPFSDTPMLNNMGFLASHDPVALDAVTYALIQENLYPSSRLPETGFEAVFAAAERLGLGQPDAQLEHLS